MKHVICVQDLSCFGKCSLTITMPVLCSANIQVTPLPTALLSTHTGGLGKPFIHDLQNDMRQIMDHWQTIAFPVDAIYSGYVSNQAQLQVIETLFSSYPSAYHFVDPVMGDHGKLYASLPQNIKDNMITLCQKADCITPNMTEAYALLQQPFHEGPYTEREIVDLLHALHHVTHSDVILTGVSMDHDQLGCAIMEKGTISFMMRQYYPYPCHGSGDLFASSLLGAYLNSHSLQEACKIAMTYTISCIEYSHKNACEERYGIQFEPLLMEYMQLCKTDKR